MFEKVNPSHPDKVADRIAGAIVDLCYTKSRNRWSNDGKLDLSTAEGRQRWAQANPKVACEVLIGHGECNIQVETSEQIGAEDIGAIVSRIAGEGIETRALIVPQDIHLAANQQHGVRCGDNGIFRGVPPTHEQKLLTAIAASIYDKHPFDGKYIINTDIPYDTGILDAILKEKGYNPAKATPKETMEISDEYERRIWKLATTNVTVCQSHVSNEECFPLLEHLHNNYGINNVSINPLGEWTGGPNTDSGATNRKLGSDMGDGVTGGGLHGKDLSKADVSVNIWCYLESIRTGHEVTASCSIGDETVNGIPYKDIVEQARLYIHTLGGFEKFAEWGLVRPLAQV